MFHNIPSIYDINNMIYADKKTDKSLMTLLNMTYDSVSLLCIQSVPFQPVNIFLFHKFELPVRLTQSCHKLQMAYNVRRLFTNSAFSVGQFCLGTGGSIVMTAFLHQCPVQEKPSKIIKMTPHAKVLNTHHINDIRPIYGNAFHPEQSAFEPKTILKIYGDSDINQNPKLQDNLKHQMQEFLSLSLEKRVEYLDKYTHIRHVNATDCKNDNLDTIMIGQNGLFCRNPIKKYTFIGFYSGIYIGNAAEHNYLLEKVGVKECAAYSFAFLKQPYPMISGFGYGNRLSLVNASTTYQKNLRKIAQDIISKNNILAVYAKSGENPDTDFLNDNNLYDLVGYITTQDIKSGQQLYMDYGINYWKQKISDVLDVTQSQIISAISKYKKSNIKNKHTFYK